MMTDFFLKLRKAGLPVTLTEFLTLLEALSQRVTAHSVEEFYYLARAALVKDERHYDRFDQVFGSHFRAWKHGSTRSSGPRCRWNGCANWRS